MRFDDQSPPIRLNWPISKSIRLRRCQGFEQHIVHTMGGQSAIPRCELALSVHSTTHFDLPWALPATAIGKNIPSLDTASGTRLLQDYLRPFSAPVVVLDFRDRMGVLDGLLDEHTGLLPWGSWKVSDIIDCVKRLCIDMKDIESRVGNDLTQLRNRLLLFWTGWIPHFVPKNLDCSHPYFEGIHPFLVHPFLSTEAIRTLFSPDRVGAVGLCSDTSTLEFPLLFIDRTGTLEQFFLVRELIIENHQNLCELDKSGFARQVLHVETLGRGLRLGELFSFADLPPIENGGQQATTGEVLFVPLPVMTMADALLCEVLFYRKSA